MRVMKMLLFIFLLTSYYSFSQNLVGKRYAIQTRTVESALNILKDSSRNVGESSKSILGFIDIYRLGDMSLSVYRNQKGEATSFQIFTTKRQVEYNGKGRPKDKKVPNSKNKKIQYSDTLIAYLTENQDEESLSTIQIATSYWYLSQNKHFSKLKNISDENLLLGNIYPDCIAVGHPKALFVALKISKVENNDVEKNSLNELLEKPKKRKCKKILKLL